MATEVGIVMSLYDKVSPTLKSIAGNTKAFDKSLDDLEASLRTYDKAQEELVTKSSSLKKAMEESKMKVADARKEWKRLKDEASKGAFDAAIEEQEKIKQALKETSEAIKVNNDGYQSLYKNAVRAADAASKAGNHADKNGGLMSGLKAAGLTKMLGDSMTQLAGAGLESMLGQPTATAVSGILSGITSGAAMGAMTGTPHGIAAGAVIGGITGIANAATSVGSAQDDAFKGYVQEQVQGQLSKRDGDIQGGSTIAGQRQQDAIAFNRLLGDGKGDAYLSDLRTLAANTPMEYGDLTLMSRSLATGFKDDPARMLELMRDVGDAGAALGVDAGGMNTMATAMSRMQASGKVTLEYLNLIQERGVDAVEMLSDGLGTTKAEIYDLISKGKLNGVEAVQIIQDKMREMYGGAMEQQSKTFAGLSSTLSDAETEMRNAYGEGYNAERGMGIKEQTDWLTGASGEAQMEANKAIGAWQASLENAKEQYIRDAVDGAMESDDYQRAKAAGDAAEMGRIIMQAKVQGQSEYNASEGAQLAVASEKELIAGVRSDTSLKSDYWDTGYEMGQEYSKGMLAGIRASEVFSTLTAGNTSTAQWTDEGGNVHNNGASGYFDDGGNFHSAAYGMRTIPYDNFPILAHQGEQLLTASEARARGAGSGVSVTVTGNEFHVRQESDIGDIASALADEIEFRQLAGAS